MHATPETKDIGGAPKPAARRGVAAWRRVAGLAAAIGTLAFAGNAFGGTDAGWTAGDAVAACEPGMLQNLSELKEMIPRLSRAGETHTGDLPEMRRKRVVRVLAEYSRSNYFRAEGRFFGFEYSLLKEFERFLNEETQDGIPLSVEFFPLPRSILIPALVHGVGDIVASGIAGVDEPPERTAYTEPYLGDVRYVLVGSRGGRSFHRLEELAGRQIYCNPRPAAYKMLAEVNGRLARRDLAPLRIVKADAVLSPEDILEMVNAGIVDLTVTQKHVAEVWQNHLPGLSFWDPDFVTEKAELVWLVRRDNLLLRNALNRFIRNHRKGTLLGNIFYRKYFEDTQWIQNPLDEPGKRHLSKYLPLFRKYGERFDIDWRLLAAVAFQESRLDPTCRSQRGAVGLMQVLPSTARDRRIGIPDPYPPEHNVHAGAKYLALLRDEYFDDETLSSETRLRFALAAYNAGPRAARLYREKARTLGYDPDRWFHHCERAALLMEAGETVRYVDSINKYLLAYRLSDTLDCLKTKSSDAAGSKGRSRTHKQNMRTLLK